MNPRTLIGMSEKPIELEGTTFEGGGGLIRDALSYSAILDRPVRIINIRKNRQIPGLRYEHTQAIKAIGQLCGALIVGNQVQSPVLEFRPYVTAKLPEPLKILEVEAERSSVIMLLALLPVILFCQLGPRRNNSNVSENGITLKIRGATYAEATPSRKYLEFVIMPYFSNICLGDNVKILLPDNEDPPEGWCVGTDKSKGLLVVHVKPLRAPLRGFNIGKRGNILRFDALGHTAPEHEDAAETLDFAAVDELDLSRVSTEHYQWSPITKIAERAGSYHLLLVANVRGQKFTHPTYPLAAEALYPPDDLQWSPLSDTASHKQIIKTIARSCMNDLVRDLSSGNKVDRNMQDMLIPYQVLAEGFSATTVADGSRTRMDDVGGKWDLAVYSSKCTSGG
jgi:RNA 3'-terminal phosphate cyclase (ATP)